VGPESVKVGRAGRAGAPTVTACASDSSESAP